MFPPGIQIATLGLPAGHLHGLAIEMVVYLCLKLFQYSEVTGNARGNSGKTTSGKIMYQIDHGYIWIATDCRTKSVLVSQM